MAFLDYQNSDAKIKPLIFVLKSPFQVKRVLNETLVEDVKLVMVEKVKFKKLDVIIVNFLAFSAGHESDDKKHTHYGRSAGLVTRTSQKTKIWSVFFQDQTLMLHGFDINIRFLKPFTMDPFELLLETTIKNNVTTTGT